MIKIKSRLQKHKGSMIHLTKKKMPQGFQKNYTASHVNCIIVEEVNQNITKLRTT